MEPEFLPTYPVMTRRILRTVTQLHCIYGDKGITTVTIKVDFSPCVNNSDKD